MIHYKLERILSPKEGTRCSYCEDTRFGRHGVGHLVWQFLQIFLTQLIAEWSEGLVEPRRVSFFSSRWAGPERFSSWMWASEHRGLRGRANKKECFGNLSIYPQWCITCRLPKCSFPRARTAKVAPLICPWKGEKWMAPIGLQSCNHVIV